MKTKLLAKKNRISSGRRRKEKKSVENCWAGVKHFGCLANGNNRLFCQFATLHCMLCHPRCCCFSLFFSFRFFSFFFLHKHHRISGSFLLSFITSLCSVFFSPMVTLIFFPSFQKAANKKSNFSLISYRQSRQFQEKW